MLGPTAANAGCSSEATFDEVVDRYQGLVLRICISKLKDDQAAGDAAQETFVSAWRHIEVEGWPRAPLQSWLACIAVHKCVDELRRRARRGPSLEASFPPGRTEPKAERLGTEDTVLCAELLFELEHAVSNLPDDLRASLLLHSVQGKGYGEIARLTQVPVGTVKSRIHRARLGLRAHLDARALSPQWSW